VLVFGEGKKEWGAGLNPNSEPSALSRRRRKRDLHEGWCEHTTIGSFSPLLQDESSPRWDMKQTEGGERQETVKKKEKENDRERRGVGAGTSFFSQDKIEIYRIHYSLLPNWKRAVNSISFCGGGVGSQGTKALLIYIWKGAKERKKRRSGFLSGEGGESRSPHPLTPEKKEMSSFAGQKNGVLVVMIVNPQ